MSVMHYPEGGGLITACRLSRVGQVEPPIAPDATDVTCGACLEQMARQVEQAIHPRMYCPECDKRAVSYRDVPDNEPLKCASCGWVEP